LKLQPNWLEDSAIARLQVHQHTQHNTLAHFVVDYICVCVCGVFVIVVVCLLLNWS